MTNFESYMGHMFTMMYTGDKTQMLDETAMKRLQLAQRRQQLQRDQERHHDELQQMLEMADKDREDRGANEAEDEEIGIGNQTYTVFCEPECCFVHGLLSNKLQVPVSVDSCWLICAVSCMHVFYCMAPAGSTNIDFTTLVCVTKLHWHLPQIS